MLQQMLKQMHRILFKEPPTNMSQCPAEMMLQVHQIHIEAKESRDFMCTWWDTIVTQPLNKLQEAASGHSNLCRAFLI
jgi:hypothetical protein